MWKPIDEAKRDGTPYLLAGPGPEDWVIAHWLADEWRLLTAPQGAIDWDLDFEPTHFQELTRP